MVWEDFLEEGTDPLTDEEKLASFCRKGRRQFYWPGKFKGVNTFLERLRGETPGRYRRDSGRSLDFPLRTKGKGKECK